MKQSASVAVAGIGPREFLAGVLRLAGNAWQIETDRARTGRNAVAAFLVRLTSAGALYFTQVALARWLGAFEYGIYVFVWTWVLVLGNLSNLGLSTAVLRLVPQYCERGEHAALRGILLGSRLAVLAMSSATALSGLTLLWFAGDMIGGHYTLPAYLALICIPLCTLTDIQDGLARSRGWMGIGLLPPYVVRPLLLLACMAAAHFWRLPMNAETAAGAAVVACWGAALMQTALLQHRFKREFAAGPRSYEFAHWFRAALPFWAITACDLALQNADVLIVSALMGPAEAGMYFAAAKTMSLVMFIHYAVGSAVANQVAALDVRGNREQLAAFVKEAVSWTFWPSLAGTVGILLLGKPMLSLFSPQFTDAYPVMCILALGFLARASMGPADVVLNMLGQQSVSAKILIASAASSVSLSLFLVPVFGMLGAAAATSIALLAASAMHCIAARRRLGIGIAVWHRGSKPLQPEGPGSRDARSAVH